VADDELCRGEVGEGEVGGDVLWERGQGCVSWEREVERSFEGRDGAEDDIDGGVHREGSVVCGQNFSNFEEIGRT